MSGDFIRREDIRDTSPQSLNRLNNMLRNLFHVVFGNIDIGNLSRSMRSYLSSTVTVDNIGSVIEQNDESIRLAVGAIGNSNLIRNSDFAFGEDGMKSWSTLEHTQCTAALIGKTFSRLGTAGQSDPVGALTPSFDLLSGAPYVATLRIGGDIAALTAMALAEVDGTVTPLSDVAIAADGAAHDTVMTFTAPKTMLQARLRIAAIHPQGAFTIERVMLQEGNKATAWCRHGDEMKNASIAIDNESITMRSGQLHMDMLDNEGDVALSMSTDGGGFNRIVTDSLQVRSVKMGVETETRSIYVDGQNGSDNNMGTSSAPFKSIGAALGSLNRTLYAPATIYVRAAGLTYYENLYVAGFSGPGPLAIRPYNRSGESGHVYLRGYIKVVGCSCPINIGDPSGGLCLDLMDPQYQTAILCYAANCTTVTFESVCINGMTSGGSRHGYAFLFAGVAAGMIGLCHVVNVNYALHVNHCGSVISSSSRGSNQNVTVSIFCSAATVFIEGVIPEATQAVELQLNGEVRGALTMARSSYYNTAPPPPAQITTVITAVSTRSYRDYGSTRWRLETDVYQGNYGYGTHWGCLWFNIAGAIGAGKTILAAKLHLKRKSAGGLASAQSVTLYALASPPADPGSGPSAAPVLGAGYGTIGAWAWGEDKWVGIPTAAAQAAYAMGALAIYSGESQYAIFDGVGGTVPQLEITHQ